MPRHPRLLPFTALILLFLSGCAATRDTSPASPWVADRLYLGRSLPGGGLVSEAEWEGFMESVVTPRFPDGLTLWRAEGQWRDSSGVLLQEPVMVLEIFHTGGQEVEAAIIAIAEEYKRRFQQEAVLRVQSRAQVQFYE